MSPLDQIWAKSRVKPSEQHGELLTVHLRATRDAAQVLRRRVGVIPGLPDYFWDCVILACLLHDAGKVPAGFQRMVGNPGPPGPWGQRHEVYSLGFVAHVLAALPPEQLGLVMAGVASHHWPFQAKNGRCLKALLSTVYQTPGHLEDAMGEVDPVAAGTLHAWLQAEAGVPATPAPDMDRLAGVAYQVLTA